MRIGKRYEPGLLLLLLCACASAKPEAPPEAAPTQGAEQLPPAPTAEAAPPPPTPASELPPAPLPPEPAMPAYAGIVIHHVKDFEAWKTTFEAHADARKQATIVAHELMRGADDDKLVVLYMPAMDAAKLQAFFASPDLKLAMKNAGVQGKPSVYAFKSVAAKMAPPKTAPFGAVVAYDVKDFATFQQALDGQADARAAAGVTGYALGQGLAKPTDAYVYLQSADAAKLKQYVAAKETKQALAKGGARGTPVITIVKEGELTSYQ